MWKDDRNGNEDIYGYNLSTKEEFQITTNLNDQSWAAIYEEVVVWHDDRNGFTDIYGYNLLTKEEFQITTNPKNQYCPEIYEDYVVWVVVYGFYLSDIDWYPFEPPPESPSFSESLESFSEWFYGILVVVIVLIALLIWMRRREEKFPITKVEKESREHSSEKRN